MLLGVYWCYGFPEGLYHFDFFTFQPGRGGHADGPAELTATVRAPNLPALLAAVQAVAASYPESYCLGLIVRPNPGPGAANAPRNLPVVPTRLDLSPYFPYAHGITRRF